jgi:hypothetical protein
MAVEQRSVDGRGRTDAVTKTAADVFAWHDNRRSDSKHRRIESISDCSSVIRCRSDRAWQALAFLVRFCAVSDDKAKEIFGRSAGFLP